MPEKVERILSLWDADKQVGALISCVSFGVKVMRRFPSRKVMYRSRTDCRD